MKKYIVVIYLLINVYMFCLMYRDKKYAQKHEWRITERRLLLGALCFGGTGMLLGMKIFRHKTKHFLFQIVGILTCIIQNTAMLYYIVYL